jgi:hypothetical protein
MTASTPVSPWIKAAAYAIPLCVLPSAAWRLAHAIGVMVDRGRCDTQSSGELVYIVGLSVVSMGAALLTIGLVSRWGEVFPRWLPVIGGREVPARKVTVVAVTGATLIALLTVIGLLNVLRDVDPRRELPPGCEQPGFDVLVFYIPLVAWAPLLYLVTYDYYRRHVSTRRAEAAHAGSG